MPIRQRNKSIDKQESDKIEVDVPVDCPLPSEGGIFSQEARRLTLGGA